MKYILHITSFVAALVILIQQTFAGGICDTDSLLALKNTLNETTYQNINSRVYHAICKSNSTHNTGGGWIALPGGVGYSEVHDNESLAKLCMLGETNFKLTNYNKVLYSTLSDDVKKDLVFACAAGGVDVSAWEASDIVSIKIRYQKTNDGWQEVPKLYLNSIKVYRHDGKDNLVEINCPKITEILGDARNNKIPIKQDGITAICARPLDYEGDLSVKVTAIDEKNNPVIPEEVRLSGARQTVLNWDSKARTNEEHRAAKEPGGSFRCHANEGAYVPSIWHRNANLRGHLKSLSDRIGECIKSHGTHIVTGPGGNVTVIMKQKNKVTCLPLYSDSVGQLPAYCKSKGNIIIANNISLNTESVPEAQELLRWPGIFLGSMQQSFPEVYQNIPLKDLDLTTTK